MNHNSIDFKRQRPIFDPDLFNQNNYSTHVIGCGATGSYVVLQLAKLGIKNIHIWDNDAIESHNIPNQLFGINDIGKSKVDVLSDYCDKLCNIHIEKHTTFVDEKTNLNGDIVFLLTDSMSSRKNIYTHCIKNKSSLCIETRTASTQGRIYTFNPQDNVDQIKWENTLYSDEQADVSECGTTIMMGCTSSAIASIAVWQLIKWYRFKTYTNDKNLLPPEFEISIGFSPELRLMIN